MKESKLAVFVEGQTEQILIEKLVREIAGSNNVRIRHGRAWGGGDAGPRIIQLDALREEPPARYYVQIVSSCTDGRVASDINDNYDKLVAHGFTAIIGVRDVYPFPRTDISKIMKGMRHGQKTKPVVVDNVLAVMEVESWFLGEHHHLSAIGTGVSVSDVIQQLGFDPSTENMEDRDHPASDLDLVYRLAGKSYTKKRAQVQDTVEALDYTYMYCELSARMNSLQVLVTALDRFLES